jgi:hypothetical protein
MTLTEKRENFNKEMSELENFLGLAISEPPRSEVEEILQLRTEEIRKLPSVELAEYSFMLSQYALFLQHKYNEYQTFLQWCGHIRHTAQGDEVFTLKQWAQKVELRSTKLVFMSKKVEDLSRSLNNLCLARYKKGDRS